MPALRSPLRSPLRSANFSPTEGRWGSVVDNRLAAGALVAFPGDSILEYNNTASTGVSNLNLSANGAGELVQCQSLDPRFNIDTWLGADTYDAPYGREFYGANQGYAGQTSTTVLARKSNALSQGADLYVWAAGTNDGLENAPAQVTAVANAQTFANDVIALGKRLLIIGIRPTGSSQNTAQRIAGRKAVNTGLAAIATANPGVVYFVDLWTAYDPNGDDIVDVGFMADALHPTAAGAYAAATGGLLTKLREIIAPGDIMALNGNAELMSMPFAGSGGTSGHANITGTIPAGWTVDFHTGNTATVVCSVVNGELVLNITGGAGSTTVRVRPTTNITTVTNTDWLKLMADLETTGGNIRVRLEDNLGVTNYYASGLLIDPATTIGRAKSITPSWMARSTAVRPCVLITAGISAPAFVATIHSMTCKKQTSPKTTRNAGSVPTVITPLTISGTGTTGQTLTATPGTYNQNSDSVAQTRGYRWYRNGVFRGSSTGTASTYVVVAGDVGSTITCGESAANPAGRGTESISNGIAVT